MKTKNRPARDLQKGRGTAAESLSHYQCNYRDIKNQYKPTVQFITADSVYSAVEIFMESRRREGWNTKEIFVESLLLVKEQTTRKKYVFNKFGEPKPYNGRPVL